MADQIEQDYQFRLGYLVIESLVRSAQIDVVVDDAGSTSETDRVNAVVENLRDTWSAMLPSAMRAFAYGRAAFEKTYRYDAGSSCYLVAGLDYLPPDRTELVVGEKGEFGGITLAGPREPILLEPARTWWFALDPTPTEPHGRSRYQGAPLQIWHARRQLDEQERIWYSKFAIGHGVARAPDAPSSSRAAHLTDASTDPMEAMRQELSNIESGGILILSSRTGPDGKYLYDYQASEGQQASGPLERRREWLDVAALRSLGVPERAITQNDRAGSRAMAQVHLEVLYRTCEGILDQILSSFRRYVAGKLIEINWGTDRPPRWRMSYRPIGDSAGTPSRDWLASLAQQLALSPTLPELARQGVLDVDRLLALAEVPTARLYREVAPAPADASAARAEGPLGLSGLGRLESNGHAH
jgi:hypothetical protein